MTETRDEFYARLQAAADAKFAGWVDGYGPNAAGREALKRMAARLIEAAGDHLDNTGAPCRIDLAGHDCCYTCNIAEAALRILAKYEAP